MRLSHKSSPCAILTAAMAVSGLPAASMTLELLPLGDSITFGVSSDTDPSIAPNPDDDLGGYRYYLNDLALGGFDFDFVGNREDGSGLATDPLPFDDNQHFGVRGGEASLDTTDTPSLLTGIFDSGPGVTSQDASFDSNATNPDAALLRIGVNSLPKNYFRTAYSPTFNTKTKRLLNDIDMAANQFAELLDGDATRPDGLISRLTDEAFFAEDAHLFVALITPRLNGDTSNPDSDTKFNNKKHAVAAALYNNKIKTLVEDRMNPTDGLDGRVTFVDLFSITLAELDLNALATEFFGSEADPMAALLSAINPDSEGGTLATDYVDWALVPFDEGVYEDGAFAAGTTADVINDNSDWNQDLLEGDNQTGNLINANLALLEDGLHPTNLGYAIEAQVWANAINSYYVPEPSALVLVLGGGLLMSTRRRRA